MILTSETFSLLYSQSPKLLCRMLDNPAQVRINGELCEKYQLKDDQQRNFILILASLALKKITPTVLENILHQELSLPLKKVQTLTCDVLGRVALPMQWYIGNVEGLIKDLGGDVAKYETEARKNYPEVYAPDAATQATDTTSVSAVPSESKTTSTADEPAILRDIADKLSTPKGRATVLLRLTALSLQIEEAGKSGQLTADETSKLLYGLDALSYSVNTQDLNPLEIGAIKRRLKNILVKAKV